MPTKTRRIVFTLVLTASSLGLDARSQSRDQRLPSHEVFKHEALLRPYVELVLAYRHRDRAPLATIRDAAIWPPNRLRKTLTLIRDMKANIYDDAIPTVDWKPIAVRAAAMLHTEVMLEAFDQRMAVTADLHREIAVGLLDLLERPEERQFKARWFVVTTVLLRWQNRAFDALAHANDGVERVPDDADLLLLAGTLHEDLARADFPQTAAPVDREDHLDEAERALRRALTINAGSEEARLHLARVLHQKGRRAEAAAELAPIVERSGNRMLRYLAHLFLGAIREEESRASEAERLYRAAIDLDSQQQAADIALSALLDRLGRRRESHERLLEMLKKGPRPTTDPWWTYPFEPPERNLPALLLSLREEVMQ